MGDTRGHRPHLLASSMSETSYEQEAREGLAVIALGLILLFGLLFVVRIGGSTGWASFAVAGFVIMVITGVSIDKIR